MKSILDLQRALLTEDPSAVKTFFDEADRRSANAAMLAAANELGFKVGFLDGWVITTGPELALLMGNNSGSSVREMRRKYGLMSFSEGSSSVEMTKLREQFGLHPNDGKTVFCGWDTLLVCGMNGRTAEADRVKLYLLDCERSLRILTDKDVMNAQKNKWQEVKDFAKAMDTLRKSPDDELTTLYREKIEAALGKKLNIPQQGQLTLVVDNSKEK